ncbi:MAG: hypothetical protein AAGB04_15900 [Pseudomonadota bacterium]
MSQADNQVEASLRNRKLTIVSLQAATDDELRRLVRLAQEFHAFAISIVFSEAGSAQRRKQRLTRIGFRQTCCLPDLSSGKKRVSIRLCPTWPDRRHLSGPFDIIGDVHGCASELLALLKKLDYDVSYFADDGLGRTYFIIPPAGRTAVFAGNLSGAGPRNEDVLAIVNGLEATDSVLRVWGDQDDRARSSAIRKAWLDPVHRSYHTEFDKDYTIHDDHKFNVTANSASVVSHLWLDGGDLIVTHAAIRDDLIGRTSSAVRTYCIYGPDSVDAQLHEPNDELDWVQSYNGGAAVVFGHYRFRAARWQNNTIGINTDCVNGGALTALRWPERELVAVKAERDYAGASRAVSNDESQ